MQAENKNKKYFAVDLFSGCGGLSEGLRQAGFKVVAAIEMDEYAAKGYSMNHPETVLVQKNNPKVKIGHH